MNPAAARRLPGIRVIRQPAPVPEALPRMDIAVLVGLAASGPVDLPVAVEDAPQFAATFGADTLLATDAATGQPARALLGPAVRAFFANGGRRCWIVRVADTATLDEDRFAIPGVVALNPNPPMRDEQAWLRARSPGSWADLLQLGAALRGTAQPLLTAALLRDHAFIECIQAKAPAPGDLLRFTWTDATGATLAILHSFVTTVDNPQTSPPTLADGAVRLGLAQALWSAPVGLASPVADVLPVLVHQGTDGFPGVAHIGSDGAVRITLDVAPSQAPHRGETLGVDAAGERWWFCVENVVSVDVAGSPVQQGTRLEGVALRVLARPSHQPGVLRCDRLSLDLSVTAGGDERTAATDLGFSPGHPRYAGLLPDDALFFRTRASTLATTPAGIATLSLGEAGPGQRFPLAALPQEARLFLPLFVERLTAVTSGARHDGRAALERDGLAKFDPALFIDSGLASTTVDRFMDEADAIRYINDDPRPLRGIHAALGFDESAIIEEATLVAVPDAALPGWDPDSDLGFQTRPIALPTPPDECPSSDDFRDCAACRVSIHRLDAVAGAAPTDDFMLVWSASERGILSVVEVATRDDFADATELYRGAAGTCIAPAFDTPEAYYRVRADLLGQSCSWAAAIAVAVRNRRGFRMRDDAAAVAPLLLQVHRALLRMCAGQGSLFAVLALPERFSAQDAIDHAERLRTIAARGFGDRVEKLAPGEERALSHGALYHAWIVTRTAGGTLARTPPDGAVCGVMAARAIARGCWIAPANEPFQATVALTRAIPESQWLALDAAGVNLVRRDPRGFMVLDADTLSIDTDLRPINVRRLLILLRRVALRDGVRAVFEPNDDALRRTVERSFEALLQNLFDRGAFAGAKPETSFQVDCGPRVNPPVNIDLGRFIVELRIAPSLPMRFLTVRLVRSGVGLQVVETGAAA
jgi:hypothetical protein